jgi:hypothetical protein
MSSNTKSKKIITCSTCGKTGHMKSNEKFHPIKSTLSEDELRRNAQHIATRERITKDALEYKEPVLTENQLRRKERDDAIKEERRLEDLEDEQDLIIIKSSAPAPIPAPVFLPRKHIGECGLEGNLIMFPLLRMGCCEDARGHIITMKLAMPKIVNKEFFKNFADIIKKYPMFDWSGDSFQRNIIEPNKEHIKMVMGLDDFFVNRIVEDLYVVINNWYGCLDEDNSDCDDYVPLNHTTFFTSRDCEY